MAKRSRGSASKGEPISKKARRESEAEASARMLEIIPPGTEEEEEEEEKEEAAPTLRPRVYAVGAQQSWRREDLQANLSWSKGPNTMKK